MTASVKNISLYTFGSSDRLFLDANIWISVLGPSPCIKRSQKIYSGALKAMKSAGAKIFIDSLVLSEFINVYARYEYNLLPKNTFQTYKQFRNSTSFVPIAQDIARQVEYILGISERVESGFTNANLSDMLSEFRAGGSDFNDQMFCALCKNLNYIFVTHDSDFKNSCLKILTCNQNILSSFRSYP